MSFSTPCVDPLPEYLAENEYTVHLVIAGIYTWDKNKKNTWLDSNTILVGI